MLQKKVRNTQLKFPKKNITLGDVNSDNTLDSRDAVIVLKYYASQIIGSKTSLDISVADINNDGKVDSSDAVVILKTYAESLVK